MFLFFKNILKLSKHINKHKWCAKLKLMLLFFFWKITHWHKNVGISMNVIYVRCVYSFKETIILYISMCIFEVLKSNIPCSSYCLDSWICVQWPRKHLRQQYARRQSVSIEGRTVLSYHRCLYIHRGTDLSVQN